MLSAPHSPWNIEGRDPYGEADTRAKLIDPAIYARGWTEEHIRREETAGGIEVFEGEPRRSSKGRVDYTLRIKVSATAQPVALAYVEPKAENKPPAEGLQQGKDYAAASKRLNVPFVFSTNGHLFVEFDAFTGRTTSPKPLVALGVNSAHLTRSDFGSLQVACAASYRWLPSSRPS